MDGPEGALFTPGGLGQGAIPANQGSKGRDLPCPRNQPEQVSPRFCGYGSPKHVEKDAFDLFHEFKIWIYFHPGGDGTSRLMDHRP